MTKEIALHRDEGQSIWMLGILMTFKATAAETDGAFGLVEGLHPPGAGAPPHVHHNEDEFFYVIDGEVEVTIGDEKILGKAGSFVFAPRDIPHSYTITGSQNSRLLLGVTPAGLEKCFVELGEPAASLTIPPAAPPDLEKLLSVAKKYKVDFLVPANA